MRYIPNSGTPSSPPVLELSRRNLETLLTKLDDPDSLRTLLSPGKYGEAYIIVRAVENEEHYSDRAPGEVRTNGVVS